MTEPTHDTSSTFPSGRDALWRYVVALGIIAVLVMALGALIGACIEDVVRWLGAGLYVEPNEEAQLHATYRE